MFKHNLKREIAIQVSISLIWLFKTWCLFGLKKSLVVYGDIYDGALNLLYVHVWLNSKINFPVSSLSIPMHIFGNLTSPLEKQSAQVHDEIIKNWFPKVSPQSTILGRSICFNPKMYPGAKIQIIRFDTLIVLNIVQTTLGHLEI